MFYVSMGKVDHGTAPILFDADVPSHGSDDHHEEDHHNDHGLNLNFRKEC